MCPDDVGVNVEAERLGLASNLKRWSPIRLSWFEVRVMSWEEDENSISTSSTQLIYLVMSTKKSA